MKVQSFNYSNLNYSQKTSAENRKFSSNISFAGQANLSGKIDIKKVFKVIGTVLAGIAGIAAIKALYNKFSGSLKEVFSTFNVIKKPNSYTSADQKQRMSTIDGKIDELKFMEEQLKLRDSQKMSHLQAAHKRKKTLGKASRILENLYDKKFMNSEIYTTLTMAKMQGQTAKAEEYTQRLLNVITGIKRNGINSDKCEQLEVFVCEYGSFPEKSDGKKINNN